jgi:hypothetical protein
MLFEIAGGKAMMDDLLTKEEVLYILDQHRSLIQGDDGLVGFAEAVQKACVAKRWRNTFRRLIKQPSLFEQNKKIGDR